MKPSFLLRVGPFGAVVFWLSIALIVFWGIGSMSEAQAGHIGPATFPKILAVSLSMLVIVYWLQSRKKKALSLLVTAKKSDTFKAAFLVFLAVAAACLFEILGALPVLLILSLVELRWIEGFGWIKVFSAGMVLSIGIWLIFTVMLGVTLPLGLMIWFY